MQMFRSVTVADHSNPLCRRAAHSAGRSDLIHEGRLDEVLLRIADKAPATDEPRGLFLHPSYLYLSGHVLATRHSACRVYGLVSEEHGDRQDRAPARGRFHARFAILERSRMAAWRMH